MPLWRIGFCEAAAPCRLEIVWLLTALTRASVAIFVSTQIIAGHSSRMVHGCSRLTECCVLIQAIGLRKGWLAMLRGDAHKSGWQGVVLVAATYAYFLIFAQFAFVHRLARLGLEDAYLKAVMAAMAVGGILVSLIAPRVRRWASPGARLRTGLVGAGTAALLSLLPLDLASSLGVSFLIGAGLGFLPSRSPPICAHGQGLGTHC